MATLSTLIGLPVSIPLGAVSLAGGGVSGVATALTKKYQKKLAKVTKLVDIVTLALAVFETSIYKALNIGRVDKQEFSMLQTFHFRALNELANNYSKVMCALFPFFWYRFQRGLGAVIGFIGGLEASIGFEGGLEAGIAVEGGLEAGIGFVGDFGVSIGFGGDLGSGIGFRGGLEEGRG